jgi:hypothetical protein
MKILKNTSAYDDAVLRKIICATHAYMVKLEGRKAPNWDNLRIKVRSKEYGWSGQSYYHGNGRGWGHDWDVFFSLSPNMTVWGIVTAVYHELMHTYGYKHADYNDIPYKECAKVFPDNPKAVTWNKPPKAPKPKAEKPPAWIAKYESAVKRKKAWETKKKRAETALKKINKTIKYYEKKYPDGG